MSVVDQATRLPDRASAMALVTLVGAFLLAPTLTIAINFAVDPLMAFHRPWYGTPLYHTDERYMTPGWIRSFPAETVVIGPSTTQAFQSDLLEAAEIAGAKNLSIAAATLYEQRLLFEQAAATGHLRRIIWGVEWVTVAWPPTQVTDRLGPFPHFLYDRPANLLQDYLINFDILSLSARLLLEANLRQDAPDLDPSPEATKFASTGRPYGVTAAIGDYFSVLKSEEVATALTLPERSSLEVYLDNLRRNLVEPVMAHPEMSFDVFLPPNSVLQLSIMERHYPAQWEHFLRLRDELAELSKRENVRVFDFYRDTKYSFDLTKYGDVQHFNREVAASLLEEIERGAYQMEADFGREDLLEEIRSFQAICPDSVLKSILEGTQAPEMSWANCLDLIGIEQKDSSAYP